MTIGLSFGSASFEMSAPGNPSRSGQMAHIEFGFGADIEQERFLVFGFVEDVGEFARFVLPRLYG